MINIFIKKKNINKFFSFFDEGLLSIFNFALGIVLTKTISLDFFGIYLSFMIPIFLFNSLQYSLIGLPLILESSILKKEKKISIFYYLALESQFQLSFLYILFLTIILFLLNTLSIYDSLKFYEIIVYIFYSFLFFFYDFIKRFLYSRNAFIYSFFMNLSFIFLFFVFFFIFNSLNIFSNLFLLFLSFNLSLFFTIIIFISKYYLFFEKFHFNRIFLFKFTFIKQFFSYSKNIMNSSVLRTLSENIFYFYCLLFLNPVALGSIRLVKSIFGINLILFRSLDNFLPKLLYSNLNLGGSTNFFQLYKKISIIYISLPLIFAFLILSFNQDILLILYSNEILKFSDASLSWSVVYFIMSLTFFLNHFFISFKKTKYLTNSSIYMLIVTIIISPIMLKLFDFNGSLIILPFVYLVPLLYCILKFKYEYNKI